MRASTLWILLAVALALGGAVWWQVRREATLDLSPDRPLLAGVGRQQVRALRIDNLERSLQLRLELDAEGGWRIRDPIDAPADHALVEQLVEQLTQARGKPHRADDLAGLSLAPPRAVVEVRVERPGGAQTRRVEVGALDLDRQSMFLRVDGELLRAPRTFEGLLDRDLVGWRSARIATFLPESVIELRRSGRIPGSAGAPDVDLTLHALLDEGWRATEPFVARLEPGLVGALLVSVASLEAMDFPEEHGAGLAHFGLDPPAVRLEVQTLAGGREVLRLAPSGRPAAWHCVREGHPQIYTVDEYGLMYLLLPAPGFLDQEIVRTPRDAIAAVRLRSEGREVHLERRGFAWTVRADRGEQSELPRTAADTARVEELIAGLEAAKVLEFLPGAPLPGPEAPGFRVEAGGRVFGGDLGPLHRTRDGAEGLLFLREGDQLAGLVDPRLLELVRTEPASLRSLQLHRLAEIDVERIRVSGAGERIQYARNDLGRWSREGSRAEARDFALLVDRLLSVRASELLPPFDPSELADPVEVVLEARSGEVQGFLLGRRPAGDGGSAVHYASKEGFGAVAGSLHEDLRKLLGAP